MQRFSSNECVNDFVPVYVDVLVGSSESAKYFDGNQCLERLEVHETKTVVISENS